MKKTLFIIGISLLSSFMGLLAQMKKGDPQAQEVIEQYLKTIGGREKLGQVKTCVLKGKTNYNGINVPLDYFIKYDKVRMEIEALGQKFVQAFDGKDTWDRNPFEGKGEARYSVNQDLNAIGIISFIFPVFLIGADQELVFYGGIKELKGKKVHHLYVGEQDRTDYFFEVDTHLLLQRLEGSTIVTFENYQLDAKTKMRIPQLVSIKTETLLTINKIEGGVQLSDTLFSFPKKSKDRPFNKYADLIKKGKTLPLDKALSADMIITKHAQIAKKLKEPKSLKLHGVFNFNQSKECFPFKGYFLDDDNNFLEMQLKDKVLIMATHKGVAWELNPFISPAPRIKDKKEDGQNIPLMFYKEDLIFYKKRGHKVEYLSREYVGKVMCHVIRLTKKSGGTELFFIDTKGYYLCKQSQGNDQDGASFLSDFRNVDGIVVPHLIYTINEDDKQHTIVEITQFVFNQPIDKKIFEFPGKKKPTPKKD